MIRLVTMVNVLIHVHLMIHVQCLLFVMQTTIVQHVNVLLDLKEIHWKDVNVLNAIQILNVQMIGLVSTNFVSIHVIKTIHAQTTHYVLFQIIMPIANVQNQCQKEIHSLSVTNVTMNQNLNAVWMEIVQVNLLVLMQCA